MHEPRWHPARPLFIPHGLRGWLTAEDSLSHRLQHVCPSFRVRLLDQGWERPLPDEALCLRLPPGRGASVRQVQLTCSGRPWVFARTVTPSPKAGRRLARIGERPLGEVLFSRRPLPRGAIEIARLAPTHPLFTLAGGSGEVLWARRSLLLFEDPLLITEVFLPPLGL